jgi:hypothetical protein
MQDFVRAMAASDRRQAGITAPDRRLAVITTPPLGPGAARSSPSSSFQRADAVGWQSDARHCPAPDTATAPSARTV